MAPNKRYRRINPTDCDTFLQAAGDFHGTLRTLMSRLRPASEDYQVLHGVSQTVNTAVRELSHDDPPWTR